MKYRFVSLNLFLLLVLLPLSQCYLGFDLAKLYDLDTYLCLKTRGFTFAIIRAYRSLGVVDVNAVANLNAAKNAGLDTDVYLFPCQSKNATLQVTQLMNSVPANLYGRIWIDVETNPSPNCGWSKDADKNCQFLGQLVSAIKNRGKKAGIYASSYMWKEIFNSVQNCKKYYHEPLWYAHYDNKTTFQDFKGFGGWEVPTIKQYNDRPALCGADIDYNYYQQ